MSNDNLTAETVASRILNLVADIGQRGATITADSVLGRDMGLSLPDAGYLVETVEDEFCIDIPDLEAEAT